MKENRISMGRRIGTYTVKWLFLLCIAFVAFEAYINGADNQANKLWLLVLLAAGLTCLMVTRQIARKYRETIEKHCWKMTVGYLFILFVLQIMIGNVLRYTPTFDLDAVYGGAVSWVENGNIAAYQDYFYYFPNNLGLLTFFRILFGIAKTLSGSSVDYFFVGVIAGSVSLTVMRFSVIWICKKLLGSEYAVVSMVLMLFCLPLYFAAATFYTDVMSMAAPALFYLFYLYSREASSWKKRIGWYLAMSLVAAVGMEIKFTVLIIVIAVTIEMLLKDSWKNCLLMIGIHILVIAGIFALVNRMVYPSLLDRTQAEKQNTPYLHWVMMGAKGDGYYNPEDYEFSRSFDDPEERDHAIKEEVIRRYREMGVQGVMNLWKAKTIRDFGDGTYALSDFLDDGPVNETGLHDWILYAGKNYKQYRTVCLGFFVMIMVLMLAGVLESMCRWGVAAGKETAIWLAFFGIWLFLMLWETSGRYFSNYLSVMLIAAVLGISYLEEKMFSFWTWLRASWKNENEIAR